MVKVFKWATSTFALLPGLAVIATNLGTPPGLSHYLVGGIIEACGAFTLLVLNGKKRALGQMQAKKVERLAIFYFVLFFVALISYIFIYQTQVVYHSKYDSTILFPFWYNEDVQFMMSQAGSKYEAIDRYGPEAVLQAINSSKMYIVITLLFFIIIYTMVFEFLTLGFGIIGSKVE